MIPLVVKDFKVELRRKFEILSSLTFVAVSSLISAYASFLTTKDILVPSFFIIVVFIAVFTSTTSFIREVDSKTIYGLKLIPTSPVIVFLSKTVFAFSLIILQGLVELLLISIFSNDFNLIAILPIFVVFSFYVAVVSAFSSALVMFSEGRGFLIPMIVFIFTLPVVSPLLNMDLTTLLIETVAISLSIVSLSSYILE